MNKKILTFVFIIGMIKAIFNIVLSLLVLVSSTGVSFYQHYCSKNDVKLTSIVSPVSCHHDMESHKQCDGSCAMKQDAFQIDNKPCCVDYTSFIKVDLNFIKALKINVQVPEFSFDSGLIAFSYGSLFDNNNFQSLNHYIPSKYSKDVIQSLCAFLL